MNLNEATELDIRSDIVVTGYNGEMADFDNPRGEIHGFRAYLTITAEDGSRWAHFAHCTKHWEQEAIAEVEKLKARVQAFLDHGAQPLDPACWTPIQPCYGSDAYQSGGWEAETVAWEREMDERF
jgi:hypothetical protein